MILYLKLMSLSDVLDVFRMENSDKTLFLNDIIFFPRLSKLSTKFDSGCCFVRHTKSGNIYNQNNPSVYSLDELFGREIFIHK